MHFSESFMNSSSDGAGDLISKIIDRSSKTDFTGPCTINPVSSPRDDEQFVKETDYKVVKRGNCAQLCAEMYGI